MAEISRSVLVPYPAEAMYALVEHVEDYPSFLPWCSGSEVVQRDATGMTATLHVSYHGVRTRFSTCNEHKPGRAIRMRLNEGPFRHLEGEWLFVPLSESACKVQFRLQYEFSSHLLDRVLGPVFNHVIGTFVDAFVRRADQMRRNAG